jgi:hypothetical protein
MGQWSRVWFDELILVIEQTLNYENIKPFSKLTKTSASSQNNKKWAHNMFVNNDQTTALNTKLIETIIKHVEMGFNDPEEDFIDTDLQNTRYRDNP